MAQEIAVIPFPYIVPVAQLREIVIDFTRPTVSCRAKVSVEDSEPSDLKQRGLCFKLSIQVHIDDVPELNKMIERYKKIHDIVTSSHMPLG